MEQTHMAMILGMLGQGLVQSFFYLNGVKIQDLSAPVTLSAGQNTITSDAFASGILSGTIIDSPGVPSSLNFNIQSSSTLTISGSNTYSGGTVIGKVVNSLASNTGTSTSSYAGTLGKDFSVNRPITITHLSYYDSGQDGLTNAHDVKITSLGGGVTYASATIPSGATGAILGGYRYIALASPIVLSPGNYTVWGVATTSDFYGGSAPLITYQLSSGAVTMGTSRYGSGTAYPNVADTASYCPASFLYIDGVASGTIKVSNSNSLGIGTVNVNAGTIDYTLIGYGTLPVNQVNINLGGALRRYALESDYTRIADYGAEGLSDGPISTIIDQSGNGRNLTVTGGVSATTLNGRMTIYSDGVAGTNSRARWTGTQFSPSARWVVASTTQWWNAGSGFGRLFSANSDTAAGEWTRANAIWWARNNLTANALVGSTTNAVLVNNYLDGQMNVRSIRVLDGAITMRRSGLQEGAGTLAAATSNIGVITLFDDSGGDTTYGNGVHNFRKFVWVDCGASGDPDTTVSQLEGILSWRDGLQGLLDGAHAYKSSPPVATITFSGKTIT